MQLDFLDRLMPLGKSLIPVESNGLGGLIQCARFQALIDFESAILRGQPRFPAKGFDFIKADTIGTVIGIAIPIDLDVLRQDIADQLGQAVQVGNCFGLIRH